METNAKTAIEYSNWLNKWCELHEYKKVDGGVEDGGHFISDEVLFDNFIAHKKRELLSKMYDVVDEKAYNYLKCIASDIEHVADILLDEGYEVNDICEFLRNCIPTQYI